MNTIPPPLWILSGERKAGKTTFCQALLNAARSRGIDAAGVISPAVIDNGEKIGFEVLDVRSGESRPLAELRGGKNDGIVTKRWKFDMSNFTWGTTLLKDSIPCELLVVDELGPMELEQGIGWVTGIAALSIQAYTAAVVVIRPELLEKALELWPHASVISIDHLLSPAEESALVEKILQPFAE